MTNEEYLEKALLEFQADIRNGHVSCTGCRVRLASPCHMALWLPPGIKESEKGAKIQMKLGNVNPDRARAIVYGMCLSCTKLYKDQIHLIEDKLLRDHHGGIDN